MLKQIWVIEAYDYRTLSGLSPATKSWNAHNYTTALALP